MKIVLIILFLIPMFCSAQTISQRVTSLEIYDINNTKNIKALVKSDSLAASRELVLNGALNALQIELTASKMLFTAEIKRINDSLSKYKTYYFDTSFNYSDTYSFRVKNDTISVIKKQ